MHLNGLDSCKVNVNVTNIGDGDGGSITELLQNLKVVVVIVTFPLPIVTSLHGNDMVALNVIASASAWMMIGCSNYLGYYYLPIEH